MTPDEEARHVELAEAELRQEYATLPPNAVHAAVQAAWNQFTEASIRDFVPLFVKREARAALAGLGERGPRVGGTHAVSRGALVGP
jgi:hypothetical protein